MLTWPVTWSRPNQLTQDFEFADVTAMNLFVFHMKGL